MNIKDWDGEATAITALFQQTVLIAIKGTVKGKDTIVLTFDDGSLYAIQGEAIEAEWVNHTTQEPEA